MYKQARSGVYVVLLSVCLTACASLHRSQEDVAAAKATQTTDVSARIVMTPKLVVEPLSFDGKDKLTLYVPQVVDDPTDLQNQYLQAEQRVGAQLAQWLAQNLQSCGWYQRKVDAYLAMHAEEMVSCSQRASAQYFRYLRGAVNALESVLDDHYQNNLIPVIYHSDKVVLELMMTNSFSRESALMPYMHVIQLRGGLLAESPYKESKTQPSGVQFADPKMQKGVNDMAHLAEVMQKQLQDARAHMMRVLQCFSSDCAGVVLSPKNECIVSAGPMDNCDALQ